jgi:carboxymethylenebutenolidase
MAPETFELLGQDGRAVPGYLACAGPAAVIVVPEIFGLNEQMKNTVRRLASEGNFTAFGVDLFEGRTTTEMAAGFNMAQHMSWKTAIDHIRKARAALSELGDGARVGILGFCFGGGVALAAAAHIRELAACVPFYGIPTAERADLGNIACKVQGHFAKFDKHVSKDRVDALEQKLADAGVVAEIHRYHAQHAFMNEVRKESHSAYNAQHAWARTLAFLRRELLPGGGM